MAGARVGYAFAPRDIIREFEKNTKSFWNEPRSSGGGARSAGG